MQTITDRRSQAQALQIAYGEHDALLEDHSAAKAELAAAAERFDAIDQKRKAVARRITNIEDALGGLNVLPCYAGDVVKLRTPSGTPHTIKVTRVAQHEDGIVLTGLLALGHAAQLDARFAVVPKSYSLGSIVSIVRFA